MADPAPFQFRSTATVTRFTGLAADNARALLSGIRRASDSSIFYHVFHALFRRHFTASEFMNDYARWVWYTLHERTLAEKLAAIDPTAYTTTMDARRALARVLEESLGDVEFIPHVRPEHRFFFVNAQTFVFPTGIEAKDPRDFAEKVARVPPDVIFHHFVMAPMRLGRRENDFGTWMASQGAEEFAQRLNNLSPYSGDLYALRARIAELCRV
ncbi:MAG: DUF5752 family protein [Myxococcaceae bacterium]